MRRCVLVVGLLLGGAQPGAACPPLTVVEGRLVIPPCDLDFIAGQASSGLLVSIHTNPDFDTEMATLVVRAGAVDDLSVAPGVAEVAARLLSPASEAEERGLSVDVAVSDDYVRFSLAGPAGTVEDQARLLIDVLERPGGFEPDAASVETARQAVLAHRSEVPIDTWGRRLRYLIPQLIPSDHRYARLAPDPAYAADVHASHVRAMVAGRYVAGRAALALAARRDDWATVLPELFGTELGAVSEAPQGPAPPDPPGPQQSRAVARVDQPTAGWTLPGGYGPHRGAAPLLALVVADHLKERVAGMDVDLLGCGAIESALSSFLVCALRGADEALVAKAGTVMLRDAHRAARSKVARHTRLLDLMAELIDTTRAEGAGPGTVPSIAARHLLFARSTRAYGDMISGMNLAVDDWLAEARGVSVMLVPQRAAP